MPGKLTFNRELLIRIFFFTAFAFLFYEVFLLAKPFIPSLLMAAMLSIAFHPLNVWASKFIRNNSLRALILTTGTVLLGVLPIIGAGWLVIHEAKDLIPTVQKSLQDVSSGNIFAIKDAFPASLQSLAERLDAFLTHTGLDLKPFILDSAQSLGGHLTALGTFVAKNAFFMIIKGVLMIIALFFAFRDGDRFLHWFLKLIPMESDHKHAVAKRASDTFRAVTIGVFITAAAQGFTAMIGYLIAGVHLPVLLGLATAVASLFPGSFFITLPVALVAFRDSFGWGCFLLIWGLLVVGWLDNLLKPALIGPRARMPFVLVFFSILAGLKKFGPLGLIFGPVLIASLLTFIEIYRESYEARVGENKEKKPS